ncbi:MAG TPA: nodulation protein NfeD [Methylococcus sp.]|nr:nodulation protein NfeD [Methylococcus sp.]
MTVRYMLVGVLSLVFAGLAQAEAGVGFASKTVLELELEGVIGPATSDYVIRALDEAAERNVALVVLRMDTPGGLDTAMRQIIKKILGSPVPVVGHVAPAGSRAASAGTYILYACHIAAMAPATNLGAATPVEIPFPTGLDEDRRKPGDKTEKGKPETTSALRDKAINDAVAYIRGLAKLRGRNADWAEQAVRQSVSLPAEDALRLKVIDLVARDTTELLEKLQGREVQVLSQPVKLDLTGARVERLEPDWRSRFLGVLANPNIAYILMLFGIYGIILELFHPGTLVPGTIGAICLLLALYALQALPVNYAGVGLILLGVGLMIAEAFVPGFGILAMGGAVAFVVGSVILLDTQVPGFGIDPFLIAGFAVGSAALFVGATGLILRARKRPVVSGREEMVGAVGQALEDFESRGMIRVHGEIWFAETKTPIRKGQSVKVRKIHGLTLEVEPWQENSGP